VQAIYASEDTFLPAEATVDVPTTIRILSSMATRRLLADLTTQFEATSPLRLSVESVGGVDAAKRVRAGEPFDIVVLANNVIDALIAEGHIVEGSRVDLVASPVASPFVREPRALISVPRTL
jgi:molybdate transport system substrate-binding protein